MDTKAASARLRCCSHARTQCSLFLCFSMVAAQTCTRNMIKAARILMMRAAFYGRLNMQDINLRDELRSLDGDLFLCHLFTPDERRTDMLTSIVFMDSARIPFIVSEPMLGTIRYQWCEVIDGKHLDTAPISGFQSSSRRVTYCISS